MKVSFSKKIIYTPDFNDNTTLPLAEQCQVELTPLSFEELMHLMEAFKGVIGDENGDEKVDEKSMGKYLKQMRAISKDAAEIIIHRAKMNNLNDVNGESLSIEDVTKYPSFMPLLADIVNKLCEISTPSETDTKNLKQQPD